MYNNDSLFMKWCHKYWLYVSYSIGIMMFIVLLVYYKEWESSQKLMCSLTFMLTLHIFEENTYPGGFPYMNNLGTTSTQPLVYPQNIITNMITNLGCTLLFVLLTILSPYLQGECITIVIVFGIGQVIFHTRLGIHMYYKYKSQGKRTIYGPGLINTFVCLLPLSIAGVIWCFNNNYTVREFILGFILVISIILILIILPFVISTQIKSKTYALRDKGYFNQYK